MGFEQLAELKKQLSAEAKAKAEKPKTSNKPKRQENPVDPVVLTIGRLQKLFPATFPKNPAPKVPLKIGIFDDLAARSEEIGIAKEELKVAIKTWCRSKRYQAATIEGAPRIDLEGNAAGAVSASEAAQARALENHRAARRQPPKAAE